MREYFPTEYIRHQTFDDWQQASIKTSLITYLGKKYKEKMKRRLSSRTSEGMECFLSKIKKINQKYFSNFQLKIFQRNRIESIF